MRFSTMSATSILIAAICLSAQAPEAVSEAKGLPPRQTPADYQAQAPAGAVTIAAEFTAHGVATPQGVFTSEDFVAVELGVFGPPDARVKLSVEDFSIRINGKKTT